MVALRLAALWLGLTAPASAPEAREAGGEVVLNALEVLDEPDDAAYASGELRRGDRVAVVSDRRGPWLAIAPPTDAFDWADALAIRDRATAPPRSSPTGPRSAPDVPAPGCPAPLAAPWNGGPSPSSSTARP